MNEYFEKIPDVGSEFIYLENITDLLGELEITLGNKCYETEKILFKNQHMRSRKASCFMIIFVPQKKEYYTRYPIRSI